MNIIAVDDEQLALEGIVNTLKRILPDATVTGFSYTDPAIDYALTNKVHIAFLDIEMYEVNGIDIAKKLIEIHPDINIIFSTGYREYMEEAFDMYVSGYILKPCTEGKIRKTLENLRHPVKDEKRIVDIKTFGSFEIFVDDIPIKFGYKKTKELLAILVDKEGRMCTVGEAMSILWEDDDDLQSKASYMKNLQSDLSNTFKKNGIENVLIKQRGALGIDVSKVKCDLFDFKIGGTAARSAFQGEYMTQYSWAESRIAALEEIKCSK